jgi:hypothetical protein
MRSLNNSFSYRKVTEWIRKISEYDLILDETDHQYQLYGLNNIDDVYRYPSIGTLPNSADCS